MTTPPTGLVEAQLYRDAGAVQRYHTKRTIRSQNIAEHTFGMLMLIKQVSGGIIPINLVYGVLHHDLPELMTGDVPAPIKRAHPALGPLMDEIESGLTPLYSDTYLNEADRAMLKWADRMELVLWCMEEVTLGNSFCKEIVARGLGWIINARIPHVARELTIEVATDAKTRLGIVAMSGADLEKYA